MDALSLFSLTEWSKVSNTTTQLCCQLDYVTPFNNTGYLMLVKSAGQLLKVSE